MVRTFLIRGMLVGILAGLITFAFAKIFGEPQVDLAIAFEDHMHQMAGDAPEPELVSRQIQSTIGLLTGVVVYGCALGGIFSLVFAYAYGRMGKLGARATAAILAAGGFVAIIIVPQIKYPANPPSIGNPETIGMRTELYFGIILISIIALVAAINLGRGLVPRLGRWNACLSGAAAYLVVIAIAFYVLPAGQRGSGRLFCRGALELPARLARHASGAVDDAGRGLRTVGGAPCFRRSSCAPPLPPTTEFLLIQMVGASASCRGPFCWSTRSVDGAGEGVLSGTLTLTGA